MPVPRGGGIRLVEALAELIARPAARSRPAGTSSASLVSEGRADGVRTDRRRDRPARAGRCSRTSRPPSSTAGSLPEADPAGARGREPLPLRPVRHADPLRALGAAALGGRRAPRRHRAGAPHARPRRRLARRQRGRRGACCPPRRPIVVGQPLTMDPSRAPEGAGILWIQLQELPWHVKGDAAGELDATGEWTEELRERYADRIQARIARHIPNLESSIRKRVVLSPADLAAANVNLERGDPYAGALSLDQNFLWRPLREQPGPRDAGRRAVAHRRLDASRARGSAAAPARSSPRSSSARRCRAARSAERGAAWASDCRRSRSRRSRRCPQPFDDDLTTLPGGRRRRHRPLGDQVPRARRRRDARPRARERPHRHELRRRRPVDPAAAAAPRAGRPWRSASRRSARWIRRHRAVRAGLPRRPDRPRGRARPGRGARARRRRRSACSATRPSAPACASRSSPTSGSAARTGRSSRRSPRPPRCSTRPATGARAHRRHLAPLEHAVRARAAAGRGPDRRRARVRLPRADARLARPRAARRRRRRRRRASSPRSRRPAGRARTTSRSSPTTALRRRLPRLALAACPAPSSPAARDERFQALLGARSESA